MSTARIHLEDVRGKGNGNEDKKEMMWWVERWI